MMTKMKRKNSHVIIIREAHKDDAIIIKKIVESVAAEKYYAVQEHSREDWNSAIKEINERKGLIIIAEANGNPAGMAYIVPGKFKKNKHVGFLGISIFKTFRRISAGTALMGYILDWSKKQKELEKISLTVFSTNKAAINLYKKFGFEIEGISKKQFKIAGKYVDEVIMGKILN